MKDLKKIHLPSCSWRTRLGVIKWLDGERMCDRWMCEPAGLYLMKLPLTLSARTCSLLRQQRFMAEPRQGGYQPLMLHPEVGAMT